MDCAALKRKFDEAQAQADESARVRVFRDVVALLEKLRCSAAEEVTLHSRRKKAWCQKPVNRANLSAAHSHVDETLDRIAALSASIPHPLSLTPPVLDCQWQADDTELLRQCRARNLQGKGAAAGWNGCRIGAHRALQQLNSVPNSSGVPQNRTPQTAHQQQLRKKREHALLYDATWSPAHCADSSDSLAKTAKWIRFNQVAEGVVDRTTFLEGTEQFLELLAVDQVSELHASSSCMSEYYHSKLDGAVMAIQNTGGNPGYLRAAAWIELAMLPRLLAAVAFMVIYPLCVCDCTLL